MHRGSSVSRVGLVVHPRREIDAALAATRGWASTRGVTLGQVAIPGQGRRVAEPIDVASCDLVLALGGDGAALAALHAAAPASRPVLGVACGKIGVGPSPPAGGPILAPGVEGMVVTPLADHGGVSPPLVTGPDSRLSVSVEPGYGGSRFEIDGQEASLEAMDVTIRLRQEYASLITFADQEPVLTGLRRRGLVVDSPRILARDARD